MKKKNNQFSITKLEGCQFSQRNEYVGLIVGSYHIIVRIAGIDITNIFGKRGLKRRLFISQLVFFGAFFIQLISTIIFCMIEGWHWTATHPVEKTIDAVTVRFMVLPPLYWLYCISYALNTIAKNGKFTLEPTTIEKKFEIKIEVKSKEDFITVKDILTNN